MDLNIALPCRISVWENEEGKVKMGMLSPKDMLEPLSDSATLKKNCGRSRRYNESDSSGREINLQEIEMPEQKIISAQVAETGESPYAVSINVSGHVLKGDEPVSEGGGNLGPAPYDLLLAALGECTAMTVRWYALQQKWPLEKVDVEITFQKIDKTGVFEKHVRVFGDALTDDQRQKLVAVAAKCPVQKTLEGEVEIRTV
jgi:putative redox protein